MGPTLVSETRPSLNTARAAETEFSGVPRVGHERGIRNRLYRPGQADHLLCGVVPTAWAALVVGRPVRARFLIFAARAVSAKTVDSRVHPQPERRDAAYGRVRSINL